MPGTFEDVNCISPTPTTSSSGGDAAHDSRVSSQIYSNFLLLLLLLFFFFFFFFFSFYLFFECESEMQCDEYRRRRKRAERAVKNNRGDGHLPAAGGTVSRRRYLWPAQRVPPPPQGHLWRAEGTVSPKAICGARKGLFPPTPSVARGRNCFRQRHLPASGWTRAGKPGIVSC